MITKEKLESYYTDRFPKEENPEEYTKDEREAMDRELEKWDASKGNY